MNKVIINQDFEEVDSSDLLSRLSNKKLCIFGDSCNNAWIYNYGLKKYIECIFDNDEKKWGGKRESVLIVKPEYIENAIVITVLLDLVNVIPQIRRLGYKKFYFVCKRDIFEEYYRYEAEFYHKNQLDYIWHNEEAKFIHIIPDQKFIKPLVYIIENGFDMKEHAFLIYSFNLGNRKNQYDVWALYERLQKVYGNVAIVDGIFSFDKDIDERLSVVKLYINKCKKIIIHGEWMSDYIYKLMLNNLDKLKKKGVLIPWSGNFGYDECNNKFIDGVLRYCNSVCLDKHSDGGKRIIDRVGLRAQKYISNGLNYSQPIELPRKIINRVPKVLVGHSCYSYNKIPEALSILAKFAGDIEVYCITSYGEEQCIIDAEIVGDKLFGCNFFSVKEYMEYEDYVSFLNEMDLAVYAMDAGAGNTTLQILCYTGTKLLFKPGSNTYEYAKKQGYYVYDYYSIPKLTLDEFLENSKYDINYAMSKKNFSMEYKILQWKELLES